MLRDYGRLLEVVKRAAVGKEWTASCTQRRLWGMTDRGSEDGGGSGSSSAACSGEPSGVRGS